MHTAPVWSNKLFGVSISVPLDKYQIDQQAQRKVLFQLFEIFTVLAAVANE